MTTNFDIFRQFFMEKDIIFILKFQFSFNIV